MLYLLNRCCSMRQSALQHFLLVVQPVEPASLSNSSGTQRTNPGGAGCRGCHWRTWPPPSRCHKPPHMLSRGGRRGWRGQTLTCRSHCCRASTASRASPTRRGRPAAPAAAAPTATCRKRSWLLGFYWTHFHGFPMGMKSMFAHSAAHARLQSIAFLGALPLCVTPGCLLLCEGDRLRFCFTLLHHILAG